MSSWSGGSGKGCWSQGGERRGQNMRNWNSARGGPSWNSGAASWAGMFLLCLCLQITNFFYF